MLFAGGRVILPNKLRKRCRGSLSSTIQCIIHRQWLYTPLVHQKTDWPVAYKLSLSLPVLISPALVHFSEMKADLGAAG